jgi:hypothetical protein
MKPNEDQQLSDKEYQDDCVREDLFKYLKEYVNNFLYDKVPHTMTIGEFDDLSNKIYQTIIKVWE